MWQVVITDSDLGSDSIEQDAFGESGVVRTLQTRSAEELISRAQDADGLLVQWSQISREVLEALPRLKAIVRYGVGLDNIDLDAARELGVAVKNVPDYCVDEVALHSMAMIMASARRISDYSAPESHLSWAIGPGMAPFLPEDDAIGIVGLGRIGQRVAALGHALGFEIHGYDPFPVKIPSFVNLHENLVSLASAVNHLTLHVPSMEANRGLCDEHVIAALGNAGHLVNTSRGALVDESALLDALNARQLRWASLDVFSLEPPVSGPSRDLYEHPRVTSTPHMAYLSTRSITRLRSLAAAQLRSLLEGWSPETALGKPE